MGGRLGLGFEGRPRLPRAPRARRAQAFDLSSLILPRRRGLVGACGKPASARPVFQGPWDAVGGCVPAGLRSRPRFPRARQRPQARSAGLVRHSERALALAHQRPADAHACLGRAQPLSVEHRRSWWRRSVPPRRRAPALRALWPRRLVALHRAAHVIPNHSSRGGDEEIRARPAGRLRARAVSATMRVCGGRSHYSPALPRRHVRRHQARNGGVSTPRPAPCQLPAGRCIHGAQRPDACPRSVRAPSAPSQSDTHYRSKTSVPRLSCHQMPTFLTLVSHAQKILRLRHK